MNINKYNITLTEQTKVMLNGCKLYHLYLKSLKTGRLFKYRLEYVDNYSNKNIKKLT